jgi:hypothetical protein
MVRKLFGLGSHGGIVGDIQRGLVSAGGDPGGVDEIYGPGTALAVRAIQVQNQMPDTGDVDQVTWAAFMQRPLPTLFERSLELTAAFEGHSYTLAVGNFDGAGLTWGIIGFTVKSGKIPIILSKANDLHTNIIEQAFGENAAAIIRMIGSTHEQQMKWAESVSITGRLSAPWRQQFQTLGEFPEIRKIQRQVALTDYYVPCLKTSQAFKLNSELGVALCFDIHVQDGSINSAARALVQEQLDANPEMPESDLRAVIANAVADGALADFREDVRSRKLTIATGRGSVHGASYDLSNWGLGEFPVEDESLTLTVAA